MANNGQGEKIGDDVLSGSGKHADSNIGEENRNEGAQDPNPGEKDVCKEGNATKKAGRDEYYNESDLQNNIMQPSYQLQDAPILAVKIDAQKGGQQTI
ncbi:hypothetical protein ACSBR2_033733 [Camellia fascicularis]